MWPLLTGDSGLSFTDIVSFIQSGGSTAVFVLIVYGFLTERIVPGKRHREDVAHERARGDKYESLFLRGMSQAERSTDLAARAVDKLPPPKGGD